MSTSISGTGAAESGSDKQAVDDGADRRALARQHPWIGDEVRQRHAFLARERVTQGRDNEHWQPHQFLAGQLGLFRTDIETADHAIEFTATERREQRCARAFLDLDAQGEELPCGAPEDIAAGSRFRRPASAPMRRCPMVPLSIAAISSCVRCRSLSRNCARSTKACPLSVSATPRFERSNRAVPKITSISPISLEIAGWVRRMRCAARCMEPAAATASSTSRWRVRSDDVMANDNDPYPAWIFQFVITL